MRNGLVRASLLGGMMMLCGFGWGQETAPAPVTPPVLPAEQNVPAQPVPSANPEAPSSPTPAQAPPAQMTQDPNVALPAPASPVTPDGSPAAPTAAPDVNQPVVTAKPAVKGKKEKEVYTGPTEIVTLEPTPMLDEEGRQRLDPDGKPMFNPGVKQQRDKKGHPLFDDKGKPVFQTAKDLGYDQEGHRIKSVKEKEPKKVSVAIEHGTLTVDGMTGKAGLNYQIADLKYIYLYAPWVGLTVVSADPFPGAIEQKDAFNDKTLTVTTGEHTYQLYSEKRLLGKKPESAYVLVDRDFSLPTRQPLVGYGNLRKPPYAFPGSKEIAGSKGAPPLPENLRPVAVLPPCPAGQMRPAGVPGQPAPACVAIK